MIHTHIHTIKQDKATGFTNIYMQTIQCIVQYKLKQSVDLVNRNLLLKNSKESLSNAPDD